MDAIRGGAHTFRNLNPYTSNMAFNMTYRTIRINENYQFRRDQQKDQKFITLNPSAGYSTQSGGVSQLLTSGKKNGTSLEVLSSEPGSARGPVEVSNKFFKTRPTERLEEPKPRGIFALAHETITTEEARKTAPMRTISPRHLATAARKRREGPN